jgi:hypothetical protein
VADRHRYGHTRGEIGMGEIADFLAAFRNGQRADRDIEPSLGEPIKISDKIGFAKFEIDLQVIGDFPPQLDTDPAPGTIPVMNVKRRPGSDADDILLLGNGRCWNGRRQTLVGRLLACDRQSKGAENRSKARSEPAIFTQKPKRRSDRGLVSCPKNEFYFADWSDLSYSNESSTFSSALGVS